MGTEVIEPEAKETAVPTELEEKIIRQIEYYFGNYNLSKDKFLKSEIQTDEGWVSLETMIKFNRLKVLSEDFKTISEAIKKSPNQLMEVNEDCTKIRRKIPLPESVDRNEQDERTLYVKGFGKNTKLDEILEFFKGHKVENVFMRKRKQGKDLIFKGSVFALFQTKEDSEKFLNITGQKFNKTDLLKEKKKDYVKRKDIFYKNLRAEKEKKEKEKQANAKEEVSTKGCLLRITGLDSKGISKDDIRTALNKFGKVAYVDFFDSEGDTAIVRFDKGIVNDILKDVEEEDGRKKLEIKSVKLTVNLIEGEEENEYLEKVAKNRAAAKMRDQSRGGRGRFNKYNHGKRFNKRNWDDDESSERPNKKVKEDAENESGATTEKSNEAVTEKNDAKDTSASME